MSRPKRQRRIHLHPSVVYFKPAGIRLRKLKEVVISFEEFEAIRLKDFLQIEQKRAAESMNISQSTFHRIIIQARKKISDALVNGKAIKIEGGNFIMKKKSVNNIKIAISSTSNSIEGDVDSRFGRCPFFLIVTLEKEELKFQAIENMKKDMQGGVGIAIAQMLANENIDIVITKNIGPRALDVLKQFQIDVYQYEGSIREAIKNFKEKKLKLIED